MKKRVISLLLALVLLVGMVPGVSAFEDDAGLDPGMGIDPAVELIGEGTEDDPIQISNAEQLAMFAGIITDPEQGAKEAICAELTADIDLENEPWTPMGTDFYGYKGTFDGKGHQITGLNVSTDGSAGLFACVDGGTVKNLAVSGSVVGTGSSSKTGAIVGYLKNGGTLYRCGSNAIVIGSGTYTGGLAGQAGPYGKTNTIEQCYNAGAVTGKGSYAGGILGSDDGLTAITDCYNTGTILGGGHYAGGIRSRLGSYMGEITNCYNAGTITGETVGAIAPGKYDGSNCYAVSGGTITKEQDETEQKLTKAELLEGLSAGRTGVWEMSDGYPVLSWQKTVSDSGAFVRFARELVRTMDDEETSLPTALLRWSAQDGAKGYLVGIWQKVREWRDVDPEKLTIEPTGTVDSWSRRLLQLDQNAIIAEFSAEQKKELLRLQTIMDEKFAEMNKALETKLAVKCPENPTAEEEKAYNEAYKKANDAYVEALKEYDAAYQDCCKYIILQAVEMELPLGDYFAKLELKKTVEVEASQTYYDCTQVFAELGDGVYYPSVTAIGVDGTQKTPTEKDVSEDPYTRMNPVTRLSWNGAVAQWEGKENFTADQAYRVDLYEVTGSGYRFVNSTYIPGDVTQANCRSAFTAQRSYAFTVTAIADATLNATYGLNDSVCSPMSSTYTPADKSVSDEWVEITSARQWVEIANTEDVPSDRGDSNSPSMQEVEWSKNYRLANDIDFSELSPEDQVRTKSIGTKTYMFQGEFDGNDKKILGLTLTNSDSGLFAFAGSESRIHDMQIENPNVYFSGTAAVLALNNYGIIENCAVINCNISADVSGVMGGMAGRNYGIIRKSYVRGGKFVSTTTTATGHAGFVGSNEAGGLIESCWTSMDVSTQSVYAGGFVGLCYGGTIRNCFALGNVSARGYSGGFVGRSVFSGNVYENCYAAGKVTCFGDEGHGFIGGNKPDSSFQYDQSEGIKNCYYNQASEKADTNYGAHGLSLEDMKTDDFCKALGSSWLRTDGKNNGLPYLSGVEIPTEFGESNLNVTIVLALYNMETYRYERFGAPIKMTMRSTGNTVVSDVMDEAMRRGYLTYGYSTTTAFGRFVSVINDRELSAPNGWMFTINDEPSNLGVTTAKVQSGDTLLWYEGTTQNHFRAPSAEELDADSGYWTEISTAEELLALAQTTDEKKLAGNYILTQDIDMGPLPAEFPGIGSESAPFTGTFDGNGKTISNLSIYQPGETNVGLFRVVFGGTVKNLTLQNAEVCGKDCVGAVVGWAKVELSTKSMSGSVAGLIGNVHVTNSFVTGHWQTGGIVGLNGGASDSKTKFSVANAVDRCSFAGGISGRETTGGIAGQNDGSITLCQTSGSVDAVEQGTMAGGAAGENNGDIYDSCSKMTVQGRSYIGGFVGSGTGSVKRCYSTGDVSGGGYVGGFAGSISNVETALSTGTVTADGSDGQGYKGGFAGHLGGAIVGTSADITVKNVYGYCGSSLSAAGRTDYTQTSDGLDAALAAMILRTPEEARQKLKELFGVGGDLPDPDKEQAEREKAAKAMDAQIEALPEADALTLEDGAAVDAAMEAFDLLKDDVKLLVGDDMKAKLEACIKRMQELRQAPEDPVKRFEALMQAVPERGSAVWQTHGNAIKAARAYYNEIDQTALDKDQKKQVKTLYSQLTAAEKTYAKNEKAADRVNTLIGSFPFADSTQITLSHEKTITAAKKAYEKLSKEQQSFVDDEKEDYLLNKVWPRIQVLVLNKQDIQALEKRLKKLPADTKIKITDKETLDTLLADVEAMRARGLELNDDLLQKLEGSKKAFDEGVEQSSSFLELLSRLNAANMGADAQEIYDQAQSLFDANRKLLQRFTTKAEQNKLKLCQKALKKNQSAAAKVNKLTGSLPQADQEAEFTKKEIKTIESAMKAYRRLTTDAERSFLTGEENLLACYRRIHPDEIV